MFKKLGVLTIFVLTGLSFFGCSEETTFGTTLETTTNTVVDIAEFYFNELNNVLFPLAFPIDDFVGVEGNNIAIGNYYLDNLDNLVIKGKFLADLEPGIHRFTVLFTDSTDSIQVNILDQNQEYRIINSGFETGDLTGWSYNTIFKGETNLLSVREDLVVLTNSDNVNYNSDGDYLFGFDYTPEANTSLLLERKGTLRSSEFILGGNGIIDFKLGASSNSDLTYLSIKEVETGIEVARFGNSNFNQDTFMVTNQETYTINLNHYYSDLSEYLGNSLYLEVYDYGGSNFDYFIFDSFEMYNEAIPVGAVEATNIVPVFQQNYVTNTLLNGDFSQGLDFWDVSRIGLAYLGDIPDCFTIDNGVLKSNINGDSSKGIIRSSLFRVDGSGVVSIDIGAASGIRYDKDTYISIREYETNNEVFRFANRNSDGIQMTTYYIDLSDYFGDYLYFEIVDNGAGSYDSIFVDSIITFYLETPIYDYSQMAVNLNE
jgi:hypothetical protein